MLAQFLVKTAKRNDYLGDLSADGGMIGYTKI
jgi:hypothetical protein